jgi:hypothetical protein
MIPAALLALTAFLLGACGDSGDDPATTSAPSADEASSDEPDTADADQADVEVIEAWAKALADGKITTAARFFATPSVAENGATLRIADLNDAKLFNASLPCGAELVAAHSQGDFTTATFRLTERPGPGSCGPGAGGEAQTTFVIEHGEIAEWRRVGTAGSQPAPGEAV